MLIRRTTDTPDDPPEVYPAREDTTLLLEFARALPGERMLEIGCGRGLASLAAARLGGEVYSTDLNPHALRSLARRARAEGLRVNVVRTDLARGLGRFDRILANPPYLPTRRGERDPDRWHDLALNGGPDGTRVTRRILAALPRHLSVGGNAFLLVSTVQSEDVLRTLRARWRAKGGKVRTAARRKLEGDELEVWELSLSRPIRPARRASGSRRRTGNRPPAPPPNRPASSRGLANGRTRARDGA
jgi:HemK-related putative methylase